MFSSSINDHWQLTSPQHKHISVPFSFPNDIHSILIKNDLLLDPYLGTNETEIQWVGESEWCASRRYYHDGHHDNVNQLDLCLRFVDTIVTLSINQQSILICDNMFRTYQVNILPYLNAGENLITMHFHRNDLEAKKRADNLPFPIPWAKGNNQIPHMNLLRKTQCHAGWDWGICLLAMGVYQPLVLTSISTTRLNRVTTQQIWNDNDHCKLIVCIHYDVIDSSNEPQLINIDFTNEAATVLPINQEVTGSHKCYHRINLHKPNLWWPAGYGDQPLYDLTVTLNTSKIHKRIGLRHLELENKKDDIGRSMLFKINNQTIMAKGANWIPMDARPSQQTPQRYRQLLEDAVTANMNMIRVWGGGMYEHDIFYDLCDELGILVWQDFMFACALYPSTPEFIADVTLEITDQVNRLIDHPSLVLWCGDNEVIGAVSWYPESKHQREKYLVNYDRLNRVLHDTVRTLDPSREFWASSPCNGELDFGDAWHDDKSGDMHFWDVWHSGRDFEAYESIKPRFCSEFGYQSWPSLPTVKAYIPEEDWNITSPSFEQHQKNKRGNSIMTEMFTRYFRFPNNFEQMLYLSQVQQAIAIKTASEYWRAHKSQCRGILYWQLNDCWPVSSWSSIEYTGRWKQLHYHAKRFFAPQLVTFVQESNDPLSLYFVNDHHHPMIVNAKISQYDWQGHELACWNVTHEATSDSSDIIWQCPEELQTNIATSSTFFYAKIEIPHSTIENIHFPCRFKAIPLQQPNIIHQVHQDNEKIWIELDCDYPALFVHLEYEGIGRFDDSSFTLLPSSITGEKRRIHYIGDASIADLQEKLVIYHLRGTYA